MRGTSRDLESVFPASRRLLGDGWPRVVDACREAPGPASLVRALHDLTDQGRVPVYVAELADIEWAVRRVTDADVEVPREADHYDVNPTLEVLHTSHKLTALVGRNAADESAEPEPGQEWVFVWRGPHDTDARVKSATNEELLAVKMVVEGMSAEEAARIGALPRQAVDGMLRSAVHEGVLIGPGPRITRRKRGAAQDSPLAEKHSTASTFTLQWHITQACDLHCKHCYDRSKRSPMTAEQGLKILDDLVDFCRNRNVRGHVSFTGGNPLLYPHFYDLYRAAAQRWFTTSVLGNPAQRDKVQAIVDIQQPGYYQVSLEGLREHNNDIRGPGHFDRVMEFLDVLRDVGVPAAVMLTLTADNIDQVLPLAELLRGKADRFTFNRLSPVGEGANLALPSREQYTEFLEAYVDAARENPTLGFKDNLINIVLHQRGAKPFGGCTGFGCGAAFNFLAVLPDGQAHACRKFPSLVGNVLETSIVEVYDSAAAGQSRGGTRACDGCRLRPVCGGCLAVANGLGLDIFRERDPHCFIRPPAEAAGL